MNREYMSSVEIIEEIANLKLQLAFQIEFEQEIAEILSENQGKKTEHDDDIEQLEKKVLQDLFQAKVAKKNRLVGCTGGRQRLSRILTMVALLLIISFGSAFATLHFVKVGILKINVEDFEEYSTVSLVQTGQFIDIPKEWEGEFFLTHIPNEYTLSDAGRDYVEYSDAKGGVLYFTEKLSTAQINLDTEGAVETHDRINGCAATVFEKDDWTTVVWSTGTRYFMLDIQGDREIAVQIASSVTLIK